MEKIDLSKMLISDSEFYNKYSSSAKFFAKYNITTLEQLLDSELLENKKSLHKSTQTEIKLINVSGPTGCGKTMLLQKSLKRVTESLILVKLPQR